MDIDGDRYSREKLDQTVRTLTISWTKVGPIVRGGQEAPEGWEAYRGEDKKAGWYFLLVVPPTETSGKPDGTAVLMRRGVIIHLPPETAVYLAAEVDKVFGAGRNKSSP